MDLPSKKSILDTNSSVDTSSRFSFFRKLGCFYSEISAKIHYVHKKPYLLICCGSSYQIYDVEDLNIVFSSSQKENPIEVLDSLDDQVLLITSGLISLEDRCKMTVSNQIGKKDKYICSITLHDKVGLLLPDAVDLFDVNLKSLSRTPFQTQCLATTMIQPTGYANKILVAFEDRHMELWNFGTQKLVYKFEPFSSPITALVETGISDIVGVGLESGDFLIFDVRLARQITCFSHPSRITCARILPDISGTTYLLTGLANGHIFLWDLEKKTIIFSKDGHQGFPISSLNPIPNSLAFITVGYDNAIREWVVENAQFRLLRERSGHHHSPNIIRFLPDGDSLITASSMDSNLRFFSLIKDSQSFTLSQNSQKSLSNQNQVSKFDYYSSRELKWANLVSIHRDSSNAFLWRLEHKKAIELKVESRCNSVATCARISKCGNYVLVGTQGGDIEMFNLQSGACRKSFKIHSSPILDLGFNSHSNSFLSFHQDGFIAQHNMDSGESLAFFNLETTIDTIYFGENSGLLAVLHQGKDVALYDLYNQQKIRVFTSNLDKILDVEISADSRWLVVGFSSGSLEFWDITSGLKMDVLKVGGILTCFSISPKFDMVAVGLENDPSIHLFYNSSLYGNVSLPGPTHVLDSNLPLSPSEDDLVKFDSGNQRNSTILLNSEQIKRRNKPSLPSNQKVKNFPFFLDSIFLTNKDQQKPTDVDSQSLNFEPDPALELADISNEASFDKFAVLLTMFLKRNPKGSELEDLEELRDKLLKNWMPFKTSLQDSIRIIEFCRQSY